MSWNSNRKSLQQRILESNCRLCGKKGHWRNECPFKNQGSTASQSSAAVTVSLATNSSKDGDDDMPAEFMNLPVVFDHHDKDILSHASCFVQSVFSINNMRMHPADHPDRNMRHLREKIRNHIKGNREPNFGVQALVDRIEKKLQRSAKPSSRSEGKIASPERILRCSSEVEETARTDCCHHAI